VQGAIIELNDKKKAEVKIDIRFELKWYLHFGSLSFFQVGHCWLYVLVGLAERIMKGFLVWHGNRSKLRLLAGAAWIATFAYRVPPQRRMAKILRRLTSRFNPAQTRVGIVILLHRWVYFLFLPQARM
jgi:hypothetical protein